MALDGATLGKQVFSKPPHRIKLWLTVQHPALPALMDQPDLDQALDMVRKRRTRYLQLFLDFTHRQASGTCFHQQAEN